MRVLIVHNEHGDRAVKAAETISSWLAEQGMEYVIASKHEAHVKGTSLSDGTGAVDYDLAIAIVRCARLIGFSEVPILGYDFGTLGFLAGIDQEDLIGALKQALNHELTVQRRATLQIRIDFSDGSVTNLFGLNEVAVTHGASGRIVDFDLLIDNVHVAHLRGDGMIIATATARRPIRFPPADRS